jgi:hypothetical protein
VLALLAPLGASAGAETARSAAKQELRAQARAEREARREARKEQRAEIRSARKATREAAHEERRAEREARRAAREQARVERYATSEAPAGESSAQQPSESGQGETAGGSGAQTALTPRAGCTITAAASSAEVALGESVTLSGKLLCPAGIEVDGQPVTISEREMGASEEVGSTSSTLVPAGSTTIGEDGSYEFHSAALTGHTAFILRTPGARRAARVVVRVNAAITLEGPAASGSALAMSVARLDGGPTRRTFSGVVQPASEDLQVALRVRYGGEEWRTVAYTRTDAEGHYSFSHRFRFAGDVEVLTSARPRGDLLTRSQPILYTILQAQNPALTIQSSAPTPSTTSTQPPSTDPASSPGSTSNAGATTISGVASGGANQTVTLLARDFEGSFAPVATTTTGAGGAYSFDVEPTQTTVYEVACARNRSTQVRVLVS